MGCDPKKVFSATGKLEPVDNPGLCLDVPGGVGSNGAQIWLWDCEYGTIWEFRWQVYWEAGRSGRCKVFPASFRLGGHCIDAPGEDYSDNSSVWLWDCNEVPGNVVPTFNWSPVTKRPDPKEQTRIWQFDAGSYVGFDTEEQGAVPHWRSDFPHWTAFMWWPSDGVSNVSSL